MTVTAFLEAASAVAATTILLAMLGVSWRLMKGPTAADRIVALDMLGILLVGFAGVFAVSAGETAFLDVALALAFVAFLGTVAFARYLERRREARTNVCTDIRDVTGPERQEIG